MKKPPIKVTIYSPEDPQTKDELETRKARSFVRALVSEYKLSPKQIDELIDRLKQRQAATG